MAENETLDFEQSVGVADTVVAVEPRTAPMAPSTPSASTDTSSIGIGVLAERYEILGLVGRGGMGNVYRVRDRELDEVVALKTLHPDLARDAAAIERFRAEVKLARRVTHRNVARTYDIGMADGVPFLTMEYVDGAALDAVIEERGHLEPSVTLEILESICEGLIAAHDAGIVHRDLKPQNVLLDTDGRVVISDFGIARARDASVTVAGMTAFAGTPAYMAPEQVRGLVDIDGRADLYALGVMVFEMLTGKRPFGGPTPLAEALARMIEPVPELPADLRVPRELRGLVQRCLALDRDERYATAAELATDVSSALATITTGAHPVAPAANLRARETDAKTVAVLPFALRCGGDVAYLREGLMEELIDGLSMSAGLRVKPRGAVARYADVGVDPLQAGRELDVQVVVDGSFRVQDDQLHIRLSALSVAEGFQLWAQRFEGPIGDLFKICQRAVSAIAQALTVQATTAVHTALTDPVTIDLYMRARKAMWTHWHVNTERARDPWERVLERAPGDPRVLAGAATFFARLSHHVGRQTPDETEFSGRAARYATQAIEAAPHWPEPYCARAVIAWNAFDLHAALRDARRALELAPGYVDAQILVGKVLMELGPLDEAIRHLEAAHTNDPNAFNARWELARARALQRNWIEVDALLSLPVDEADHRFMRGIARARTDMWRDDPQWLDAPEVDLDRDENLRFYVPAARHIVRTGEMFPGHELMVGTLRSFVASHRRTAPVAFQHAAEFFTRAGRLEEAREMLAGSVSGGLVDLMWLRHCPLLDAHRDDSTFADALAVVEKRVEAILGGERLDDG